ncbi:MAG: hypothetical protein JEY99_10785 [Spirochaetales bacterium]|nr:hypothetical protein [Spirochaetales bacterium]
MSKKRINLIPVLVLGVISLLMVSGCKTLFTTEGNLYAAAKDNVRQNHFDMAVDKLVQAVNIDPEYKRAILFLEKSYPEGLDYYRVELNRIQGEDDLSALDYRASLYNSLVDMSDSIKKLPDPLIHPKTDLVMIFEINDYSEELKAAVTMAAEGYYLEGMRLAGLGSREAKKEASKAFLKTLAYIPGYKDAESRESAAREGAIQQVVFLPFRGDNYTFNGLDANELLFDKILSLIVSDSEVKKYTRIVDRSILDEVLKEQKLYASGLFDESTSIEIGELVSANMAVSGRTSQLTYKKPETEVVREFREVEVTPTAEELGREPLEGELITVSADCFFHEKSSSARLIVSYNLIDIESGTVLQSDTLRSDVSDSAEWITVEGDKRVLSYSEMGLVSTRDRDVKDSEELILECIDDMGKNIAEQLASYLR